MDVPVTFSNGTTTGPTVTEQPTDQVGEVGQPVSFTASASGDPTPLVQWEVSTDGGADFAGIPGATATTYTLVPTSADNGNQYKAIFTGPTGWRPAPPPLRSSTVWPWPPPPFPPPPAGLPSRRNSRRSGVAGASPGARSGASSRRGYRSSRTARCRGHRCLNPPLRTTRLPFAHANDSAQEENEGCPLTVVDCPSVPRRGKARLTPRLTHRRRAGSHVVSVPGKAKETTAERTDSVSVVSQERFWPPPKPDRRGARRGKRPPHGVPSTREPLGRARTGSSPWRTGTPGHVRILRPVRK